MILYNNENIVFDVSSRYLCNSVDKYLIKYLHNYI